MASSAFLPARCYMVFGQTICLILRGHLVCKEYNLFSIVLVFSIIHFCIITYLITFKYPDFLCFAQLFGFPFIVQDCESLIWSVTYSVYMLYIVWIMQDLSVGVFDLNRFWFPNSTLVFAVRMNCHYFSSTHAQVINSFCLEYINLHPSFLAFYFSFIITILSSIYRHHHHHVAWRSVIQMNAFSIFFFSSVKKKITLKWFFSSSYQEYWTFVPLHNISTSSLRQT